MYSTLEHGPSSLTAHQAARDAHVSARPPRRRPPGVASAPPAYFATFLASTAAFYHSYDAEFDTGRRERRYRSDTLDETVEPSWELRRSSKPSSISRHPRRDSSKLFNDWQDLSSHSSQLRSPSSSTSSESLSPRIARIAAFTSKLAQITSTRAGFEDAVRVHAGATSFDLPELELPRLPTLFPHGTPVLDPDEECTPFSPFPSSESSMSTSSSTPFVTPLPTPLEEHPTFLPSPSASALSPRSTRSSIDSVFSSLSLSPSTAEDTPLTSAAPSTTSPRHSFADSCSSPPPFSDRIQHSFHVYVPGSAIESCP